MNMSKGRPNSKDCSSPNESEMECRPITAINLQDLFNQVVSIQTANGPNFEPPTEYMDCERKEFLSKALQSMTFDVVELVKQKVAILKGKDSTKIEEALEEILDLIEDVDIAKVFYQVGGLEAIVPVLSSPQGASTQDVSMPDVSTQALVVDVITKCCRNNPFCQELSKQVLGQLILLALKETEVNYKAVAAISAIVQNLPSAIFQFRSLGGYEVLRKVVESTDEKMILRVCSLIKALCDTDPLCKDELWELGITQTVVSQVRMTKAVSLRLEHILQTLESLITDNVKVMQNVKKNSHLIQYLDQLVLEHQGDDTFTDMREAAARILRKMHSA